MPHALTIGLTMEYYVEQYMPVGMLNGLGLEKATLRLTIGAWSIVIRENITKKKFELQSVEQITRNYDPGKWYRFTFKVYD
jgi:hypothetical protein